MSETLTADRQVALLRELHMKVVRGEPALIGSALQDAANEIERLGRVCKKHEATIQRYEDAFVNGDEE
jgi:hypothetical protein